MWDAIVAGAGPAGAVAAFVLAHRGHRVLLVDNVAPSGCKIGETLAGASTHLLRSLDLPTPEIGGPHYPIGGNLSSWNSDILIASEAISDPGGPGWRLDRRRFDADLRTAALKAGATYRAARVRKLERQSASWTVRFDDGSAEQAGWIVDASGRRSALARRLGVGRLKDLRVVALYAVGQPDSGWQLNRTIVEAAPSGWWYAARLPAGEPIAGFHTYNKEARKLAADFQAWKRAFGGTRHVADMLPNAGFDRAIPAMDACSARLAQFGGDRWIACGDAAMSFDPISGQGIFFALQSGRDAGLLVAEAVKRRNERVSGHIERMEQTWKIYCARRAAVYRMEQRWTTEPFWSMVRENAP
jgi:flavin-dependent dehydrogenase